MSKKQKLFEQLSEHIMGLEIAGYLKEEAISCLKYLHQYKLENIEKNLTCFSDYLLFLNQQNTEKFLEMVKDGQGGDDKHSRNLSYFFSPQEQLSPEIQQKYLQNIAYQGYHLLNLMQGLRGILVLTIDEFCNASSTRIDIHKMLMQVKSTSSTER